MVVKITNKASSLYRHAQWDVRLNDLKNNEGMGAVTEELAILRLTLGGVLEKCKTSDDLIIFSPQISSLTDKIKELVITTHKIQSALGTTIDKSKVLEMAQMFVQVVSEHVKDPDILRKIVDDLGTALDEASNSKDNG